MDNQLEQTHDKGEQECREAFERWFHSSRDGSGYGDFQDCSLKQYTWESWQAAWNRCPTNGGQDGLTEDEIWKIAEQTLNSRTIKASSGYDIHFFARAIARHLSIKQATIPGNSVMYDPNDVAFPKGFMPVDGTKQEEV